MIEIEIPGHERLELACLVLDYNGTLACDGQLVVGVRARLERLSENLEIHVLTADTFGTVRQQLSGFPCRVSVIPKNEQDLAKAEYVRELGFQQCVCMGNGRNDRLMLKQAALGIAIIGGEGASIEALLAADVVTKGILNGLDLLLYPLRLVAALRL